MRGWLTTILSDNRIVSDSFNRPDNPSSLGVTSTGQAWVPDATGVWGITDGTASVITGTGRIIVNTPTSDYFAAQVTFSTIAATTNVQRLIFRYVDSLNEMFLGKADATHYEIAKRVDNIRTPLATIPIIPVSGDVLRVEVRGANIVFKLNGVVVANVNDSANSTGKGFGLNAGATSAAKFDNFLVDIL